LNPLNGNRAPAVSDLYERFADHYIADRSRTSWNEERGSIGFWTVRQRNDAFSIWAAALALQSANTCWNTVVQSPASIRLRRSSTTAASIPRKANGLSLTCAACHWQPNSTA
jgi:hypothetical protein